MHVVQISFYSDPERRRPEELMVAWPSLGDVAECVSRTGAQVSVIQASSHREQFSSAGVTYYFMPLGGAQSTLLSHLIDQLKPDVLHVHGLDFPKSVIALTAIAPRTPVVLQDHASGPPRLWRRRLWRRGAAAAAGIAFCSLEQAQPFLAAGLIASRTRLYAIPESSSRFMPGNQQEARRVCGLEGSPLVLWVGHLNRNKDPLTVLEGISRAVDELPGLKLHCCFGSAPLIGEVRRRIGTDPNLRDRVHLIGKVPHERVECLMQAADLFVLGSHREGSGYSLMEALACGLPPVVTDIPSFRELTSAGRIGALWQPGNAASLSTALKSVASIPARGLRDETRSHFEFELSFQAVGRKLISAYQDLLGVRCG